MATSPFNFGLPSVGPQSSNGYSFNSGMGSPGGIGSFGMVPVPAPPSPAPPMPGQNASPTMSSMATGAAGLIGSAMPGIPAAVGGGDVAAPERGLLGQTLLTDAGGLNMGNIGELAKIIGGFGGIWSGMQQNRLGREALSFQKEAYGKNLEGSLKSYNMALEDRVRSRHSQEGRSKSATEAYIAKHRMET